MTQPVIDDPLGYDLSCVTDLTETMAEVGGRTLFVQSQARRLITPRGNLCDDPNYGLDLTDYIDEDTLTAGVDQIAALVDDEMLKDERCLSSSTVVSFANSILTIKVTLRDALGPFILTLAVDDVTVEILRVEALPA